MTVITTSKPRAARVPTASERAHLAALAQLEAQACSAASTVLSRAQTDEERRRAAKGVLAAVKAHHTAWFGSHPTACLFGKHGRDVIHDQESARTKAQTQLDAVQGRGA